MIFKKDDFMFGLVLGLIAPIIGFFVYRYSRQFRQFPLRDVLDLLKHNPNMITAVITVSLLANIVLFTVYINFKKDKTGKGIFIMTVLYALIALAFKYF